MPRARDELEELRHGVDEIGDLRQKEEQQGLGEVAVNAHHGKRHARKVTKRVPNEDLRRVPENVHEEQRRQ